MLNLIYLYYLHYLFISSSSRYTLTRILTYNYRQEKQIFFSKYYLNDVDVTNN